MLLQMLQSIDSMIQEGIDKIHDGNTINSEGKAFIKCAKTLLEKVIEIEEIKGGGKIEPLRPRPVTATQSIDETKYVVDVKDGLLQSIKYSDGMELGPKVMIEINGTAIEYARAKGQPCKTGRVL